jgi:uncharacterized protein (DUF2132 family)
MIGLTNDQIQRLKDAASYLRTDQRAALTLAESEAYAKRIDQVLYDLHMENPLAFVTNATLTLAGAEFLPIQAMVKRRKFYNQPLKSVDARDYKSYVVPAPKKSYL